MVTELDKCNWTYSTDGRKRLRKVTQPFSNDGSIREQWTWLWYSPNRKNWSQNNCEVLPFFPKCFGCQKQTSMAFLWLFPCDRNLIHSHTWGSSQAKCQQESFSKSSWVTLSVSILGFERTANNLWKIFLRKQGCLEWKTNKTEHCIPDSNSENI